MFLRVAGSVLCVLCALCALCGSASAQYGFQPNVSRGYEQYTQYPHYAPQVEVDVYNGVQPQMVAPPRVTRRNPDFYHLHEHQWIPQQRNMYDNYCQPVVPQCYQQWQQPQQYSYTPYYYGQTPSFYVPQRSPWRCW